MSAAEPTPAVRDELERAIRAVPHWFHSIELGHGVVTPGDKSPEVLRRELSALRLPSLHGKTVIDIGAWDGFYSWASERLGARRVVSLDHFVWSLDRRRASELLADWSHRNVAPVPFEKTDAWQPATLPGKRGYDLAHRVLASKAESVVADFMDVDFEAIGGPFDVVLWLGVLYHMRHPLLALERIYRATRELAVIETEAVDFPSSGDVALCEFFERGELAGDVTNWWAPNDKALVALCRAAGFSRVERVRGIADERALPADASPLRRIRRLAGDSLRATGLRRRPVQRYRAIVHAWK
ncbi:MAG: hypothetical protein IPJ65_03675 [Archangiaceae bacterium]|nr:hypothetical protein [Archangiaceae bacterium]